MTTGCQGSMVLPFTVWVRGKASLIAVSSPCNAMEASSGDATRKIRRARRIRAVYIPPAASACARTGR